MKKYKFYKNDKLQFTTESQNEWDAKLRLFFEVVLKDKEFKNYCMNLSVLEIFNNFDTGVRLKNVDSETGKESYEDVSIFELLDQRKLVTYMQLIFLEWDYPNNWRLAEEENVY
ncbi:hypothetical protein [Radiobacillus sp. PE A8.2]|uniref:hypothetical protein n=1 Tax=Radiobacillus sp. PE A8.2 TaxID=3380349 RepID=UPI00388DF271